MVRVITISDIKKIISTVGLTNFFQQLITAVEKEFARWEQFQKSARHAVHLPQGVIELMPTCDDEWYSFKYVNGHPNNTELNKLTVVALGLLAELKSGYPLMVSEMTLLTAFRTAATSALAAKYLAKKNPTVIGIIGTGAQAEFQVLAQCALFDICEVKYFDIDENAMTKFHNNLKDQSFTLTPCKDAKSVLVNCDIITTATASKKKAVILEREWIQPGLHINGIGGDCPGKTELDQSILSNAKIVVEYLPQSLVEGESQHLHNSASVHAELWELVTGKKSGRTSDNEITLFDSVGFAIEDFAILKFIYALAMQHRVGTNMDLIPALQDPKNLFGCL